LTSLSEIAMDEQKSTTVVSDAPIKPWCLFQSGESNYALRLEAVAEVVEVERSIRLPHSPPLVLGLCALRREMIPVIALDESMTLESANGGGKHTVLILRTARGTWGLRIDAEGTIVAKEGLDDLETSDGSGSLHLGDTAYEIIDPEKTWRSIRDRVDEWYRNHWTRDKSSSTCSAHVQAEAS
jgi:purine-binding chemotaxis protein CheW